MSSLHARAGQETFFQIRNLQNPFKQKAKLEISQEKIPFIFDLQEKKAFFRSKTESDLSILHQFKSEKRILLEKSNSKSRPIDIVEGAENAIKNMYNTKVSKPKFVEQKRELFLLQLKINEKMNKIQEFANIVDEKTNKLKLYEKKLNSDVTFIEKYIEEDKIVTNADIRQAENETKERLQFVSKLKELYEKKTGKSNLNAKLFEKLVSLFAYKQFCDQIAFRAGRKKQKSNDSLESKHKESSKQKIEINSQDLSQDRNDSRSQRMLKDKKLLPKKINFQTTPLKLSQMLNREKQVKTLHSSAKSALQNENEQQSQQSLEGKPKDSTDYIKQLALFMQFHISEEFLVFLTSKSEKNAFIDFDYNDIVVIHKQVEEENLKLIKQIQKYREKIQAKEEKLKQAQILFENEKKKTTGIKNTLSKKINQKEYSIKKLACVSIEVSDVYIQNLELLTNKMNELAAILKVKQGGNLNAFLVEIESKLMIEVEKIRCCENSLIKKREKIIFNDKKMANFAEKQRVPNEKLEKKKSFIAKNKLVNFFSRKVVSRSRLPSLKRVSEPKNIIDIEKLEEERYFK